MQKSRGSITGGNEISVTESDVVVSPMLLNKKTCLFPRCLVNSYQIKYLFILPSKPAIEMICVNSVFCIIV